MEPVRLRVRGLVVVAAYSDGYPDVPGTRGWEARVESPDGTELLPGVMGFDSREAAVAYGRKQVNAVFLGLRRRGIPADSGVVCKLSHREVRELLRLGESASG